MKTRKAMLLMLMVFALMFTAVAQNQIANPYFNDWTNGDPDDWSVDGLINAEKETTIVYAGDSSLSWNSTGTVNRTAISSAWTPDEATSSDYFAYVYVPSAAGDQGDANMQTYLVGGSSSSSGYTDLNDFDADTWTKVGRDDVNVNPQATTLRIRSRHDPATMYVDYAFLGPAGTAIEDWNLY